MSLTGNLEDLPLLDILQIVSFSKKTGYLSIRTAEGNSAVVFREGFVVAAFMPHGPRESAAEKRLPPDERVRRLHGRIEEALVQLIRLREGEFSFNLSEQPPAKVEGRDISEETLAFGINAQELLLGLARGMDEDRRDTTAALEASFAEAPVVAPEPDSFDEEFDLAAPPATVPEPLVAFEEEDEPLLPEPEPPPPPPAASLEEPKAILLVDDEPEVRRVLAERFTRAGSQVVEAEDPDSAFKKALRLHKSGIHFTLVTDLGMPTSGGSSFHGGFELVKRLIKANLRPPVLLMTDSLDGAVQARARQMGIASIVFKPGLSKLDPQQFEADLRAFARKLLDDVLPRLPAAPAAPAPAAPAPSRPPAPTAAPLPTPEEKERQMAVLQERLEQLRQGGDASRIAALVMSAARDFFERALLLVVKSEQLRGLGGFGRAPRDVPLTLVAREVAVALDEPSVFADVVVTRKPYVGELPEGRWSSYVLGKIGRFRSSAVALMPLLANRETVAVLFGDNPETGRSPGPLEALAVFINQAGIAMENALLQRQVHALQRREA